MLRLVILLAAICSLYGCALTRVTNTAHDEEVRRLNLIGVSPDEAIHRLTTSGFTCYEERLSARNHRDCYKKSAELFCPQIRRVGLVIANGGKVSSVNTDIVQNGCF